MKALLIALTLLVSTTVLADDKVAPALKGMKYQVALFCDHPALALDLIKVINNQEMFIDYFRGYNVSGHCAQASGLPFTLVRKWKTTNTSYDGFKSEMWEVRMEDGDHMWVIIWPDFKQSRPGTAV